MIDPNQAIDPNESPMLDSDCTCCDTCAYCHGMDCQGEIGAVLHMRSCEWMNCRVAAELPMRDGRYNHQFIDDPEIETILARLRARG